MGSDSLELHHIFIFEDNFPISGDTYSDPHAPTELENNEDLLVVKH